MNRPVGNGVAAAILGAAALFALPSAASADGEVVAVGWWTRLPTASAPDGGINVGSAPDGPNSVAAVRIDLGEGLSSLTVTAMEAGGSPQTASVEACLAADIWADAAGGSLDEAPDIDCSTSVAFERGDDGTWTADVTALVAGQSGTASIGFVAAGPGGLGIAPSEVQYEAPTASGTPATTATSPTTDAPPTTSASPPTTTSAAPTPTRPVTTTTPQSSALVTTTTAFDERPIEETTTTTAASLDEQALRPVSDTVDSGGGGRPIREAVFLAVLAGLIGVGVGGASKWAELRS